MIGFLVPVAVFVAGFFVGGKHKERVMAAADAHAITDHLEGLFMSLGSAYADGEKLFEMAWPYLAAAAHVAERVGEYNIMGGTAKYRVFRAGWRNRAFDALKTFL